MKKLALFMICLYLVFLQQLQNVLLLNYYKLFFIDVERRFIKDFFASFFVKLLLELAFEAIL